VIRYADFLLGSVSGDHRRDWLNRRLQIGAIPTFRLVAGLVAALSSSSVVAIRALKEGLLFSAAAIVL
jgi:hypothetical protein